MLLEDAAVLVHHVGGTACSLPVLLISPILWRLTLNLDVDDSGSRSLLKRTSI